MIKASTDDLDVNITCSPSDSNMDEVIKPAFKEMALKEIADGNDWLWCDVHIAVVYGVHTGTADCQGCCYNGAIDFYHSELYKKMFVRALAMLQLQLDDVQIHTCNEHGELFENWSTRHLACMTKILEHTDTGTLLTALSTVPTHDEYNGLIHEFWEIQETLCEFLPIANHNT